jgi:hypothetical protein
MIKLVRFVTVYLLHLRPIASYLLSTRTTMCSAGAPALADTRPLSIQPAILPTEPRTTLATPMPRIFHPRSQPASGTFRTAALATPPLHPSEALERSPGVVSMSNLVCSDPCSVRAKAAVEAVKRCCDLRTYCHRFSSKASRAIISFKIQFDSITSC